MTRPMSYSRYFKTAMAIAAYRHTSARQNATFSVESAAPSTAGLNPICGASESGIIAATTSTAAAPTARHKPLQLQPFRPRRPGEPDYHRGGAGQQGGGHQNDDRGMRPHIPP